MAASNERIVSRGLSHLLRVGLDRSGSAVMGIASVQKIERAGRVGRTDGISLRISMLDGSNRCQ